MGAANDRLNSLSGEELRALSPEEYARLDKAAEREEIAENRTSGQDPLLFFGPDLNRPLQALQPVDVPPRGNEDPATMSDEDLEQFFARRDAKTSNFMRNAASLPLEFLKVINSPLETGGHLMDVAAGAAKSTYGPAQHYLRGLEGDPDISAFKDFTGQLTGQFSEEERERRPIDPALTVLSGVAPALRATKFGKTGGMPKTLRAMEDPGSAVVGAAVRPTFKALAGLTKEGVRRGVEGVKKLADTGPGQTVRDVARKVGTTVGQNVLAFTTNTSRRIQKIIATAPERGTRRIIKSFSGPVLEGEEILDKGKLARQNELVRETLGAVNELKKTSDDFQSEARDALAKHMQTGIEERALESLKESAVNNVREFNGKVSKEFAVELLEPELNQVSSQRSTTPSAMFAAAAEDLKKEFPESARFRQTGQGPKELEVRGRTGEADVSFRDFPSPKATQISSQGRGRELVRSFHQRLINAPPTTVGALQRYMWEIDDAISITDTEIGKHANRALVGLRKQIRATLSDQLGEAYDTATRQYEHDISVLHNIKMEIGIEPGQISDAGTLREVNRGGVLSSIIGSLDDADEFAYETLTRLEKASGKSLSDMAAGVATQSLLGSGLVARSEAAQAGRGAVRQLAGLPGAFKAGSVGAAATIAFGIPIGIVTMLASSVVFSPKLMQRIVLDIQDPAMQAKFKSFAGNLRGRMERAAKRGVPVSKWVQEGATIEQVLQRLEQIPEQQEQEAPTAPKQRSMLQTIGGIDFNPPAR